MPRGGHQYSHSDAIPEVSTRKKVPWGQLFPFEIRGDSGVSRRMNVITWPVGSSLQRAATLFDGPGGRPRAVREENSSHTCLCVS